MVTRTGSFFRAPMPIMVRSSAPKPATSSKERPLEQANVLISAASRSRYNPRGYPRFPAALMMVLPSEARSLAMSSLSRGIYRSMASRISPLTSDNSNSPPRGNNDGSIPKGRPGHRLTSSRVPPISWATTAELVETPSTMPARINSAMSVVTPSCTFGPLPVTTATLPPRSLAVTMRSTAAFTRARPVSSIRDSTSFSDSGCTGMDYLLRYSRSCNICSARLTSSRVSTLKP
ncbi:MAG: hypothetical protein BWY09_02515 [Candidatus Hydrogenedentes bacterium ADurb.Bin179]|nr:MAG: hypothetical protein BWY09_02515 [Candidatus Hydrogenedentes bacterium ADurb.Bin179]